MKYPKISTCDGCFFSYSLNSSSPLYTWAFHLKRLGSWRIMSRNLPTHWITTRSCTSVATSIIGAYSCSSWGTSSTCFPLSQLGKEHISLGIFSLECLSNCATKRHATNCEAILYTCLGIRYLSYSTHGQSYWRALEGRIFAHKCTVLCGGQPVHRVTILELGRH